MLIDLVPEFIAALKAPDPLEAYHRYLDDHSPILSSYWHNYVLDPESPHKKDVIIKTLRASRYDLHELVAQTNINSMANDTLERCTDLYEIDTDVDVYIMVGVGGANAGELVVGGRGIAFICLEHFTGRANPETYGLGLPPDQIPLWIAHELAHTVRYTSPGSRSEIARIVSETHGSYDYWETGGRASLLELIVNEGLAVAASRAACPGRDICDYLGYGRRQYKRLRELEAFLRTAVAREFTHRGLGYRLRYLSGGMSPSARNIDGKIIPERSGYYLGYRMVEAVVAERGIAYALRASAGECFSIDQRSSGIQTA